MLAGSVSAQSNNDDILRFTGLLGDLRLGADDVRADMMGSDPETRQIAIAMNDDAAAAFSVFTATHVNQAVSFFICDTMVTSLTVRAPIESGFAMTGPMPLARATELVAALNGHQECPR